MGVIHRNGDRYRDWSSICDQYNTAPMTRAEMLAYLTERRGPHEDAPEARLQRADDNGTSAKDGKRDATTWDTERCDRCASFHHAFARRETDGLCADCGHPERHVSHRSPCITR